MLRHIRTHGALLISHCFSPVRCPFPPSGYTPIRLKVALSEAFHSLVARYGSSTASTDAGEATSGDPRKEKAFLPREGVEAWLIKINRALGRGSEFRAAEAIMEPGPEGGLTLEGTDSVVVGCAQQKGVACGADMEGDRLLLWFTDKN